MGGRHGGRQRKEDGEAERSFVLRLVDTGKGTLNGDTLQRHQR
jgi:hypothetical protein